VYIATPEISAPATPAAIGFIVAFSLFAAYLAVARLYAAAMPDRHIHISAVNMGLGGKANDRQSRSVL
jgi:hypothetical protein